MHNLVIIGNGFDLAHGLKTSYGDFIETIITEKLNDQFLYSDLFVGGSLYKNFGSFMSALKHADHGMHIGVNFNNKLFEIILNEFSSQNWCDIEKLYFKLLVGKTYPGSTKQLNDEFESLKNHLEQYLEKQQAKMSTCSSYEMLFDSLAQSGESLILNFNYTNVVTSYLHSLSTNNLVHIHGELHSQTNPIIFGFAANDSESRELLKREDNEYLRNVKKHNYKQTSNEEKLIRYLHDEYDDKPLIDVLILGHSCGISDKHILNQIFNHARINSIRIFYHETRTKYFETIVNIDRIMDDDSNFKKLINFMDSHRMPQLKDTEDQTNSFLEYMNETYKAQETYRLAHKAYLNSIDKS